MKRGQKKKKEDSSLFVMPLFMRSPEPEKIPIPLYLSDEGKNVTASREHHFSLPEILIDPEKGLSNAQNDTSVWNTEMVDGGSALSKESNEVALFLGNSNHTDASITSSKSGEKSIKDILTFHLNNGHRTDEPKQNVDKVMKKNNAIITNTNTFRNFYGNFNRETNKNEKLKNYVSNNSNNNNGNNCARGFKKAYHPFNVVKWNETGLEGAQSGNSFFNQNRNKQLKVDKFTNARKFKTKNVYDGYKNKYAHVPPNDIKIAVY